LHAISRKRSESLVSIDDMILPDPFATQGNTCEAPNGIPLSKRSHQAEHVRAQDPHILGSAPLILFASRTYL
jgi:hypothetical protein